MSQRHLIETPVHQISPVPPFDRAQEGARHFSVRPLLFGTLVLAAGLRIVLLGTTASGTMKHIPRGSQD